MTQRDEEAKGRMDRWRQHENLPAGRQAPLGNYPTEQSSNAGAMLAGVLGILCIGVGVYFLWIVPGASESGIVSMHGLAIGQTMTICGAVFLAAGLTASRR